MRAGKFGERIVVLGSLLAVGLPLSSVPSLANPRDSFADNVRTSRWAGRLQCVPFARKESGIELVGNAWTWWKQASGVYQRGHAPEPGAVLAFRSNRTMRLGHVAVVSQVVNRREIEIKHANWGAGGIQRNVQVVDVSENNDWTAVRVALGRPGEFGSIYPTNGFIYNRPDKGTLVAANAGAPPPVPALNPAPSDLRPGAGRMPIVVTLTYDEATEEVAEAPAFRNKAKRQRLR